MKDPIIPNNLPDFIEKASSTASIKHGIDPKPLVEMIIASISWLMSTVSEQGKKGDVDVWVEQLHEDLKHEGVKMMLEMMVGNEKSKRDANAMTDELRRRMQDDADSNN